MSNTNNLIIDERSLDTVFAEDFNFKGTAFCKKSIMIKGNFQGQITSEEDLYLSPTAQVEGEIEARNLIVQGKLAGNADVEEGFALHQTSEFQGNVKASSLEVEKGALFNGNFSMKTIQQAETDA